MLVCEGSMEMNCQCSQAQGAEGRGGHSGQGLMKGFCEQQRTEDVKYLKEPVDLPNVRSLEVVSQCEEE